MAINMKRLSKRWLLLIAVLLLVVGGIVAQCTLGRQLSRRVFTGTNEWFLQSLGVTDASTLSHALFTSQSNHRFTLTALAALDEPIFRIEHTITHGPVRLLWSDRRPSVAFAVGWVTTYLYFPPELNLEPIVFESKIGFNGLATSDFHLPPYRFESEDGVLEWGGLSGTFNYDRTTHQAEFAVTLGDFHSQNEAVEARLTGARVRASGPINHFYGQRTFLVTAKEASLTYLADARHNQIQHLSLQLSSQDQQPFSSVSLQLRIEHLLADNQPYDSARLNLTLQRLATAQLLNNARAAPLAALAILLANRPELIADAAITSLDGEAELYLSLIAGPLDFSQDSSSVVDTFLNGLDASSHLRLPRELLLALFEAQYRQLEQENITLLSTKPHAMLDSTWKDNARLQLSSLEEGGLLLTDTTHLTSDLSLSQGVVTINQQKFDLLTLLAPFYKR